ncbi:ABC transporter ATP-binding protein [Bacillota bacterium Meth-B3]
MKYIQLQNVRKTYALRSTRVIALNNINLSINKGAFWGVMGKSGSGKSTLLNVLGGLTRIDEGSYMFDNTPIEKAHDMAKFRLNNVGFIVQHYALIEDRNVYENIILPLRYKGYSKDEIKSIAENKLEELGIGELRNRYPYQLSGGQRQKIAIARATIHDPVLLLADEPTGALDCESEDEVMRIIHALHALGKTIVLVTHNEHIAQQCEELVYLKNGEIAERR